MPESEEATIPTTKRERSPSFPYIDLPTSIKHLEEMHEVAKMNEIRLADAAATWGMTVKSGSLMRYIAAMGQFGLVEVSGFGDNKRIKVSASGRRILEDNRPGIRESLCSEAALLPKLVRGLFLGEDDMPHWGHERPIDSIAESSLKFDLNFTSDAAKRFLSVYDVTIKCIVDREIASEDVDIAAEDALKSGNIEPVPEEQKMQTTTAEKPASATTATSAGDLDLNDIDFQRAGKGKIKITAVLDADGLDLLEKQIAAFRMLVN